ncbi:hypothetical protein [Oceaniglobus ichthyenteri]|uniref:hypothetical protein n=1 Tax=Oceaniglobus ichthyenteri TaxID=2136177 RepID=UPI000D3C26DE|nr:hypothetical protein [Oceaniglobus ichthyenteri]
MSMTLTEMNRHIARNNCAVARAAGVAMTGGWMAVPAKRRPGLMAVSLILGAAVILTLAKAVLVVLIGADAYDGALLSLQGASFIDGAAAWMMQVDGITAAIRDFIQ